MITFLQETPGDGAKGMIVNHRRLCRVKNMLAMYLNQRLCRLYTSACESTVNFEVWAIYILPVSKAERQAHRYTSYNRLLTQLERVAYYCLIKYGKTECCVYPVCIKISSIKLYFKEWIIHWRILTINCIYVINVKSMGKKNCTVSTIYVGVCIILHNWSLG